MINHSDKKGYIFMDITQVPLKRLAMTIIASMRLPSLPGQMMSQQMPNLLRQAQVPKK